MDFSSDNASGVAPEILAALERANRDMAAAYGGDDLTARVQARFNDLFEREVATFLVPTGSAANGLSLATLTPPYGAVLCHEASHIERDECGAPEFFTGGAKLVALPGEAARLAPDTVKKALGYLPAGVVHHVQAACLSLTQATEAGTVYTPDEVAALSEVAHGAGLSVHMDGARLANAIVHLGCSPAEATWRAGVDALVFGATKNGAMAAEAVVFFDPDKAGDFAFRRKRAGHLLSKGRFLAAQMDAYLDGDLWLKLARHANDMARRLGDGIKSVAGCRLSYPVQANEVFAEIAPGFVAALSRAGARFHPWIVPGDPAGGRIIRMVTSFATQQKEVDRAVNILRMHTEQTVADS